MLGLCCCVYLFSMGMAAYVKFAELDMGLTGRQSRTAMGC